MRQLLRFVFCLGLTAGLFGLVGLMLPDISPVSAHTLPGKSEMLLLSEPAVITKNVSGLDSSPPGFSGHPLLSPANGVTVTTLYPTFAWNDATDDVGVVSYTLKITGPAAFSGLFQQSTTAKITSSVSGYTATQLLPNGVYTWTVQAHDAAGNVSGFVSPYTFTRQLVWQTFLPIIQQAGTPVCPLTSSASFDLIPIEGGVAKDHPPPLHADLNLSVRGYSSTNAAKTLQDYPGGTDANAPQLAGLFNPNQFPGISTVYRVNGWDWGCGAPHGCAAGPITAWSVTMMGLNTSSGQPIYIPERGPEIYGGGYKAMVLYAEETRLTLVYTRKDSVVGGYSVHLEGLCIDPNLLSLYRQQIDGDGWHITGNLPALRNNQAVGTASGSQLKVVIRDGSGSFMDPRSRKDWWVGY